MAATDVKEGSHVVEIPAVDEEQCGRQTPPLTMTATVIQHHPLVEISQSPGHLLLLKLWQREENLFNRRIGLKETRLDSIKREIFHLCCFFLIFHGFFLTLVYASSAANAPHKHDTCRKWWVSAVVMLCTCFVFVVLVQVKVCRYWKVWRQVQREKGDNRALTRCIQELRMKGASFDLSKEPIIGKRTKSSSVEIKWKPITWCSQNAVTILLLCFTGLVCPATKIHHEEKNHYCFCLGPPSGDEAIGSEFPHDRIRQSSRTPKSYSFRSTSSSIQWKLLPKMWLCSNRMCTKKTMASV